MARPKKQGLDYFPMDTDIFSDRKIRKLLKDHGSKGFTIFNFVLCEIYRDKGYFVLCDADFIFDVSDKLNMAESTVQETINFCVSNGLFDERVFDVKNILTSSAIQLRYKSAKRGKIVFDSEIEVFATETIINETITSINDEESTQSKVKESKRKKSKVDESVFIPIEEILKSYISNEKLVKAVCENQKVSKKSLESSLKVFAEQLKASGVFSKSDPDFKSHFLNWLRKNKKEPTQQSKYENWN